MRFGPAVQLLRKKILIMQTPGALHSQVAPLGTEDYSKPLTAEQFHQIVDHYPLGETAPQPLKPASKEISFVNLWQDGQTTACDIRRIRLHCLSET